MNKEFQVHLLNDEGLVKAHTVASDFDLLLERMNGYVPAGREFAIVKTKLEEACFFAKKAIANEPSNQKQA